MLRAVVVMFVGAVGFNHMPQAKRNQIFNPLLWEAPTCSQKHGAREAGSIAPAMRCPLLRNATASHRHSTMTKKVKRKSVPNTQLDLAIDAQLELAIDQVITL